MTDYHVVTSCNKCTGVNELIKQSFDSGHLHESSTKCKECGFEDYWAHGFFESGTDMVSKCKTYSIAH